MLPKSRRISCKEFKHILQNGRRSFSDHFVLYLERVENYNTSRFSFSISKKICKNATSRNLYRRRGYAVITKIIKQIKPNHFVFFSYKKSKNEKDFNLKFKTIESEIVNLLKQTNMLI